MKEIFLHKDMVSMYGVLYLMFVIQVVIFLATFLLVFAKVKL